MVYLFFFKKKKIIKIVFFSPRLWNSYFCADFRVKCSYGYLQINIEKSISVEQCIEVLNTLFGV